jgi:uncharacterized repeat protein (TIGR03809 family)
MTEAVDVPRGYHITARWRALAEKRLAHIVDLYESGRWRRYHDEREFMNMVRDAKAAVETWHRLAPRPGAAPRPVATNPVASRPATPVRQDDVIALLQETVSIPPRPPLKIAAPPLQPRQS